jgi:ABC-type nitrate/sulfonate/bicarbonate transport system substrate-binding protein
MKIKVALDWTPNAIHAGLYYALLKQWYQAAGLDVVLIVPKYNDIDPLPIEKLFRKEVFFAIAPSETVIKSHQNGYIELTALATLLQGSPSAFATLKTSGLDTRQKLSGKTYASLELPFEKPLVEQLAGGPCNFTTPPKLDIYDLLLRGHADFVWLFKNIEVAEFQMRGIDLNLFEPEEAAIPYGLSTLLVSHQEFVNDYSFLVKKFMEITGRAYKEIAQNPGEASAFLHEKNPKNFPDQQVLRHTLEASCQYFLDEENKWGKMKAERWSNFLTWLDEIKYLRKDFVKPALLYSNRYLER